MYQLPSNVKPLIDKVLQSTDNRIIYLQHSIPEPFMYVVFVEYKGVTKKINLDEEILFNAQMGRLSTKDIEHIRKQISVDKLQGESRNEVILPEPLPSVENANKPNKLNWWEKLLNFLKSLLSV